MTENDVKSNVKIRLYKNLPDEYDPCNSFFGYKLIYVLESFDLCGYSLQNGNYILSATWPLKDPDEFIELHEDWKFMVVEFWKNFGKPDATMKKMELIIYNAFPDEKYSTPLNVSIETYDGKLLMRMSAHVKFYNQ